MTHIFLEARRWARLDELVELHNTSMATLLSAVVYYGSERDSGKVGTYSTTGKERRSIRFKQRARTLLEAQPQSASNCINEWLRDFLLTDMGRWNLNDHPHARGRHGSNPGRKMNTSRIGHSPGSMDTQFGGRKRPVQKRTQKTELTTTINYISTILGAIIEPNSNHFDVVLRAVLDWVEAKGGIDQIGYSEMIIVEALGVPEIAAMLSADGNGEVEVEIIKHLIVTNTPITQGTIDEERMRRQAEAIL